MTARQQRQKLGDQAAFYDGIAEYCDLIYADWEGSMRRQGAALAASLGRTPSGTRILDVTAGIGTQALPLASLGYEVVARDLSEGAIRRLRREALERGLEIDSASSDVRDVGSTVEGRFDAVISLYNSLPHLLADEEIRATLAGLRDLLAPDGILLISVRDYDNVDRSATSVHPYAERVRSGTRHRMGQRWKWYDARHYRTTMTVERWGRCRLGGARQHHGGVLRDPDPEPPRAHAGGRAERDARRRARLLPTCLARRPRRPLRFDIQGASAAESRLISDAWRAAPTKPTWCVSAG